MPPSGRPPLFGRCSISIPETNRPRSRRRFHPYQAARWEHGWQCGRSRGRTFEDRKYRQAFYYDTILHSAPVLEFMIGHVGADRVMLGSDYPYDMGMMDCVKHVRSLKISDADKATILGTRAEALLSGKS
jgi:aminocarboxymuconate-semialdehyde decarboxylase